MISLEELKKLKEQSRTIVASLDQSTRAIAEKHGLHILQKEKVNERLKICEACPNYRNGHCGICLCVLALKARFEEFVCPLGVWGAVSGEKPTEGNKFLRKVPYPFFRNSEISISYSKEDERISKHTTNLKTMATTVESVNLAEDILC